MTMSKNTIIIKISTTVFQQPSSMHRAWVITSILSLVWAVLALAVITWDEKASMVSVFLVRTITSYPPKHEFPAVWSSSTVAAALHTDRRWATLAFTQGVARVSISFSLIMITMLLIVRVPMIMGSLTNTGSPELFGLCHSPGLHQVEPKSSCSLKVG